jgi:hypothetical protein
MWAQQEQISPARIVSGAGSLKSPGNQGRGIGEGWGMFFSEVASKGLPSPFNAAGWRCSKGQFPFMQMCTMRQQDEGEGEDSPHLFHLRGGQGEYLIRVGLHRSAGP